MGALDQVIQMKQQNPNISDQEIVSQLRKQNPNISPKDINDALNHAQIKSAVSDIQGNDMQAPYPQESQQYPNQGYDQQGYQDSGNYQQDQSYGGYDQNQVYTPQPQQYQNQGYDQQGYSGYDSYQAQTNTDTIVEIAEQVFDEKISEISKRVDSNEEFKTLAQSRLEQLNERLKRIEITIDKLQSAILEKIGSYGTNLESIKKEMSMMQDSFSKTLPSLVNPPQSKTSKSQESLLESSGEEQTLPKNKVVKKR